MSVSENTLKALKELGLTEYEIQAYATMIDGGTMAASDISSKSGVPFSRVYDVLGRLEEKGFIQIQRGRPTTYTPKSPKEIVRLVRLAWEEKLEASSKAVVEELQPRYEQETPATSRDVWLLYGRNNIVAKALEMLEGAKEQIILSLPTLDMSVFASENDVEDVSAIIETVLRHKVPNIYVITSSVPEDLKDLIPSNIQVRCREAFGAGIVTDKRETLIMLGTGDSSEDFLGVYSSAPVFAAMASSYFETLWKESEPLK